MPDKVAFATTNWKNKSDKPEQFIQAEWDAYNSSKFNGFPFPTIERDQENSSFSEWDRTTKFEGKPSKSSDKMVSVLGDHYSYKFTYEQLFKLFWRMKKARPLIDGSVTTESTFARAATYSLNQDVSSIILDLDSSSVFKDSESQLVNDLNSNYWKLTINGCSTGIDFRQPVLKTGQDEYRPFVECACCGPCDGCGAYATLNPGGNYDIFEDWTILQNSGKSLIVESFQFPTGIPGFSDPDCYQNFGSLDYTGQIPNLSDPYSAFWDGMAKWPNRRECGLRREFATIITSEGREIEFSVSCSVTRGKSQETGECGWVVSFTVDIVDFYALVNIFFTSKGYFFQDSAFPGTVNFTAQADLTYHCDELLTDVSDWRTLQISFPAIVTVAEGTPTRFRQ